MSWYTVHSFTATAISDTNLSSFFNTPGVADPHQPNQQWRLIDVPYNVPRPGWDGGTVDAGGNLVRDPSDLIYHNGLSCTVTLEIQVQFPTPESCPVEFPPLAFSGAGVSSGGGDGGCGSGGCGSV
jgi:hypothetical protein